MVVATDKAVSKYTVFFAASAALVVSSALGVLAGALLAEAINPRYLHYAAGLGFIAIGAYTHDNGTVCACVISNGEVVQPCHLSGGDRGRPEENKYNNRSG